MSNGNKVSCLKQEMYHQRWLEEVRQCNSRPDGMTVTEWCIENNLVPATYYSHAKKVREAYLEQLDLSQASKLSETESIATTMESSFVELPEPSLPAKASSSVSITLGNAVIEIHEDISTEFLTKILGALIHAQ